jgi:hypothetical protein
VRAREGRRTGPTAVACVIALAVVLPAAGPAAAQDPDPREGSAPEWRAVAPPGSAGGEFWFQVSPQERPPRARLGLYLQTTCEEGATAGDCEATPVVVSVVRGGPADRAGVRPGDELVSLDGVPFASAAGREALSSLEPGAEVRLVVRGASGRRELRVSPEVRDASEMVRLEGRLSGRDGARSEVRVFRLPSREGMERLELRLDSLRGSGTAFVVVSPDARGSLQVDVAGQELGAVLAGGAAPPAPVGYLMESPELAHRLERVRETALRSARVRLDSLVRLRREIAGTAVFVTTPAEDGDGGRPAAGVEGTGRATWTLRPAPPDLETLLVLNQRLAGAEFRTLTPELAEYFHGVESGLLVLRAIRGTPADRLGLRGGDVVFEAAGRPVDSVDALRSALEAANGGPVSIKWMRKGTVEEGRIATP